MTFSIAMRTMPRPYDYCRDTLRRLVDVGVFQHRSVIGFHLHHGDGLTPNQNGIGALQRAVRDHADWVLFLEDDIDVIDDFMGSVERWLTRFAKPTVRVYPLGCFYPESIKENRERGVWELPLPKYYGSQAVLLRTDDAASYAEYLGRLAHEESHFDLLLADWHIRQEPLQPHLLTPAPCFIDHLGEQSLMGTWDRTGRMTEFAGREWSYR